MKEGEQELEKKLVPGEAQGSQPAGGGQDGQADAAGNQQSAVGNQQDKDAADRDSAGS